VNAMKHLSAFLLVFVLTASQAFISAGEAADARPLVAQAQKSANATPTRKRGIIIVPAVGEPTSLHLENGALVFCDGRGARKLDLATTRESAQDRTCPAQEEPNAACSGLGLDISVRSPLSEPNDIIDFDGWSKPLKGRVHDCAADGRTLAVITASRVVLVDIKKRSAKDISQKGGDRVAISPRWVAWSIGNELRLVLRPAL
jgi:hypothetical protein